DLWCSCAGGDQEEVFGEEGCAGEVSPPPALRATPASGGYRLPSSAYFSQRGTPSSAYFPPPEGVVPKGPGEDSLLTFWSTPGASRHPRQRGIRLLLLFASPPPASG